MKEEFVPYEIALAMKELGFDKECLGIYYDAEPTWELLIGGKADENNEYEINAPLYQQAFRWFREKYGMYSHIKTSGLISRLEFTWVSNGEYGFLSGDGFQTYEEAQDACLRKLIEIVKEKQHGNN